MFNFLKPPAAKQQLPQSDVDATYKRLRWQVFLGILLAMQAIIYCAKTFL